MPRTLFPALTWWLMVFAFSFSPVHASPLPTVQAVRQGDSITLANDAISATWSMHGASLQWQRLTNHFTGTSLPLAGSVFSLVPREGPVLGSSDFKMISAPIVEDAPASPDSSKAAKHLRGRQVRIELEDPSAKLRVTWTAVLRDDANYIRQEVTIRAEQQPFALTQIGLIDTVIPGASVSGQVKGSPVTAGTWFLGFEHPLSDCRVRDDHISCWLSRELPLQAGQSVTYSSVIGVTHAGQLRRDFLNYVERERAHPYRTFLHYNSWYDLGYFDRYSEQGAAAVVQSFGEQLTNQRGVKLDSFLFDDGWDDTATLWKFNPGFPDGLAKVAQTAARYGAAPGIWLSPWGGYDGPKQQRVASARAQGFETNEGGLALSGPKYYRYFRDTCVDMIEKYGVNQFKFDGTGNANEVIKGSEFDSDFDAAIHLIGELRANKPDLYVNLTTGTYPSPFWLLYADSIWRGGEDHSFAGVGTNRQRWITYRDSQIYRWVVEEGPLFPMSSLMLHGLIFARYAERLGNDPGHDFPDEVHSYFGTGTQLQEMYITPSLLSSDDWDILAEAAKWSRDNAQTLKDSHWIGGDPARLEVYGWASWSPEKALLTLRNPSDREQDFNATLATLLELPTASAPAYAARSPWKHDSAQTLPIPAKEQHTFHLQPFQVLTLELVPSS
ncbi:MAG TPA: enterotoxin [Candidatus Acidoferrum sp.]|nr:enterotoxin [Candidatus Acidoferrum sp.]